jgi:hypothetical protein
MLRFIISMVHQSPNQIRISSINRLRTIIHNFIGQASKLAGQHQWQGGRQTFQHVTQNKKNRNISEKL